MKEQGKNFQKRNCGLEQIFGSWRNPSTPTGRQLSSQSDSHLFAWTDGRISCGLEKYGVFDGGIYRTIEEQIKSAETLAAMFQTFLVKVMNLFNWRCNLATGAWAPPAVGAFPAVAEWGLMKDRKAAGQSSQATCTSSNPAKKKAHDKSYHWPDRRKTQAPSQCHPDLQSGSILPDLRWTETIQRRLHPRKWSLKVPETWTSSIDMLLKDKHHLELQVTIFHESMVLFHSPHSSSRKDIGSWIAVWVCSQRFAGFQRCPHPLLAPAQFLLALRQLGIPFQEGFLLPGSLLCWDSSRKKYETPKFKSINR